MPKESKEEAKRTKKGKKDKDKKSSKERKDKEPAAPEQEDASLAHAGSSRSVKVVIVFYSMYTHTWRLAQAIKEGAEMVEGVSVDLYQVPELLNESAIQKMSAEKTKGAMSHIPVLTRDIRTKVLKECDALMLGAPTRFGCVCSQMMSFLEGLGGLWFENSLVGKVGSAFGGSGTQHGGQETTVMSLITAMMHLGMVIIGVPYACKELRETSSVSGGTPYGSTVIAGYDGSKSVTDSEKACAQYQGRHVAEIAMQMKYGRPNQSM